MKNKLLWGVLILVAIGGGLVVVRGPSFSNQSLGSSQNRTTVTLPVQGVEGATAVDAIKQGLLGLPGVSAVEVDLENEMATVTYDRDKLVIQALVETLQKLGYTSRVPTENQLQVLDFQVKFN